jgi:inosine-uridine nucleoside N-ribohydrolase
MENIDKNTSLILDTDPGTDDAIALALLPVYFPGAVKAIVSSFGNVAGERTFSNLVALADLLRIGAPVLHGSEKPLGAAERIITDYHGQDGLCGVVLPAVDNREKQDNFLDRIHQIVAVTGGLGIRYVILGPMTNFARLLTRFPEITGLIKEVVVMGGGFEISNMPHKTEFNFASDPVAVQTVFESNVPITLCPLDLTHTLSFGRGEIKEIVGSQPGCFAFETMSALFIKNYETAIAHGNDGALIHDATTLLYLLEPNQCRSAIKRVVIDSYGATAFSVKGRLVNVVEAMDRNYVMKTLAGAFQALADEMIP